MSPRLNFLQGSTRQSELFESKHRDDRNYNNRQAGYWAAGSRIMARDAREDGICGGVAWAESVGNPPETIGPMGRRGICRGFLHTAPTVAPCGNVQFEAGVP